MEASAHTWGRLTVVLLLGVLASAPTVAASSPPECGVWVWSEDNSGTLFTMMQNGSIMFGERAIIETSCEGPYEISIDGMVTTYTNSSTLFNLQNGRHSYSFEFDNGMSFEFSNVSVYESRIWAETYYQIEPSQGPVQFFESAAELQSRDVLIAVGSALIIWCVSTLVLWRIINAYIDRSFIEEVLV